jgi:hypothetical protein
MSAKTQIHLTGSLELKITPNIIKAQPDREMHASQSSPVVRRTATPTTTVMIENRTKRPRMSPSLVSLVMLCQEVKHASFKLAGGDGVAGSLYWPHLLDETIVPFGVEVTEDIHRDRGFLWPIIPDENVD